MSYFQDAIKGNHCYGCGPHNEHGLNIKSEWRNDTESVCHFHPKNYQCSATTKFLNGGVIATIIDCHCVCTAVAYAYKQQGRPLGEGEEIWYATGQLNIDYQRPTPIDQPLLLTAKVTSVEERRIILSCSLESVGKICATAEVVAMLVPNEWMK